MMGEYVLGIEYPMFTISIWAKEVRWLVATRATRATLKHVAQTIVVYSTCCCQFSLIQPHRSRYCNRLVPDNSFELLMKMGHPC